MDEPEPLECNLPFERLPVCACDTGKTPPTKLQRLECRMRLGPCAPRHEGSSEPEVVITETG